MRRKAPHLVLAGMAALSAALAQTTVTVTPTTAQVHLGTYYQFAAHVTGNTNTTVGWTVALAAGATGSPGSISPGGRYTPPAAMPSVNSVIVTATSLATPTASATAQVTLDNPVPTVASTTPPFVPAGAGANAVTVNGSGFVRGAQVMLGGKWLTTTFVSATSLTVSVNPAGYANGTQLPVAVMNPSPGSSTSTDVVTLQVGSTDGPPVITATVAGRFLNQAAWGPNTLTVAHVQSVGLKGYINEQLTVPISPYPDPATTGFGLNQVQARFFSNAVGGRDQLRQRVAFALGEMDVVSAITETTPSQLVPYLQILQKDAFANFRTLMEDVTLSPTMGQYLNMANNDKANTAADTRANENYARELMQLFSIGLFQLNQDGSPKLDSGGNPIPTYDETTIQNFAKVYTGWTYPTKPGATLQKHNPAYFVGPMVAYEPNHDTTSKTLLNGLVLPAGQTAEADLKAALDNIFNHPNVGPFVSKQLIQHLVTSNPSPQYVSRAAAVFNNNGSGVRGDMAAVVSAILLDSEARAGDSGPQPVPPDTSGHLREPVFLVASILRGLEATVNDTNTLAGLGANLGQTLFYPPSVFNYFAPSYMIPAAFTPKLTLSGPEFQLHSPSSAVARYNLLNSILYGNLGTGVAIDFAAAPSSPQDVADLIGQRFFYGLMPGAINTEMMRAMNAITGNTAAAVKARVQAALYVALSSSYYTVEH